MLITKQISFSNDSQDPNSNPIAVNQFLDSLNHCSQSRIRRGTLHMQKLHNHTISWDLLLKSVEIQKRLHLGCLVKLKSYDSRTMLELHSCC